MRFPQALPVPEPFPPVRAAGTTGCGPAFFALLCVWLLTLQPLPPSCLGALIRHDKPFDLSQEERVFLTSLAPIRVMADDNFSPLSYYDAAGKRYAGISIDLFRYVANALGIRYQFIYKKGLSWTEKLDLFKNNDIDMLTPASITKERAQFGSFSRPYYSTYYGAIAKEAGKIELNSSRELANYRVGVTKSTAIIPFVREIVPENQIHFFDDQAELYQALRQGKIDIGLRNKYVFQEERYNMDLFDLAVIHTIVESPRPYAFFFRKTEQYQRLIAIMDRYLAGIDCKELIKFYERGEAQLISRYVKQKNQQKVLGLVLFATFFILCCSSLGFLYHFQMSKKLTASLTQIRETDAQLRALFNASFNGILIHDGTTILDCNRELARMTGYAVAGLKGMPWLALIAPEWRAELAREGARHAEIEGLRQDGSRYDLAIKSKPFPWQGRPVQMCELQDITDRKQSEKALEELNDKLEALSTTDALTGIANRRRFDAALSQEYARHARSGAPLSLIMLDVDKFKEFNDTYGHVSGDACLRRITEVMTARATRPADLVARYGGEEFTCLLPETDHAGALVIAEFIRQDIMGLAIPHEHSAVAPVVTASLGVATVHCSAAGSPLDLVLRVDALLYQAKTGGRNRVEGS